MAEPGEIKANVRLFVAPADTTTLDTIADRIVSDIIHRKSEYMGKFGLVPRFVLLDPTSYLVLDLQARARCGGTDSHLASVEGLTLVVDRAAPVRVEVVGSAADESLRGRM